jgi:hypothetical protein
MHHTLPKTGSNAGVSATHVMVEKDVRIDLAFKALKIVSKAIVAIVLAGSDDRGNTSHAMTATQPPPRVEIHAPVIVIHSGTGGWPAKAVSARCSER